jgi:preprotein translocase subunit SecE
MMQRQGSDRVRTPERRPTTAPVKERTSPREFISEVRGELRKVAWPGRQEVVNSTVVVLIAVIFMSLLIFGFDYGSAKLTLFLFG